MRLVPQHKHQKLILQCYPPGKLADKKPNPSELSYLLYYASTRRIKLVKVVDFLAAKTKRDVKGSKSGNLQVTLGIISALIEKCADNLNAFAAQVVSILSTILSVNELPLCKSLVATYGVLCSKLDGGLFTGDKSFVESFTQFTESFINTGVNQSKTSTTNKLEWRLVSLSTAKHVFNCLGYNSRLSQKFVSSCVPLLASTVLANASQSNLLTRLNSNLNVEGDDKIHALNRTVTGRALQQAREIEERFDSDSVTEEDLNEEALAALKVLFNTSLSAQINEATTEVVEFNFKNAAQTEVDDWGVTFLEMCASWIPVQLRFIALSTLLGRLSAISDKTDEKAKSYDLLVHTAKSLLGLVSSNFNMIGLSISDVIQQLLTLQANLHLSLADHFTGEQVRNLSKIYTQCVCNLSSHIYYFDQVQDSIEGILLQVDSVLLRADTHKISRVNELVIVLLEDISKVLSLLERKSSSISRNEATLENWDLGLQLLNVDKNYEGYASEASPDQKAALQAKFLQVFYDFLETEILKVNGKSSPAKSLPKFTYDENSPSEGPQRFLIPDYNEYISQSHNFLNNILVHTNEYLAAPGNPAVSRALLKTLQTLLSITGVNFIYNFLPYFPLWQLSDSANSSASAVSKDKYAYSLLKLSLEVLDEKYSDSSKIDLTHQPLPEALSKDLADRRATQSGETTTFQTRVSQQMIHEFFAKTPLGSYLISHKSSSLDVSGASNGSGGVVGRSAKQAEDLIHQNGGSERANGVHANGNTHGLGLGSANDISSIHSGLAGGPTVKINGLADTSLTQHSLHSNNSSNVQHNHNYRYSLLPKVTDLKSSVNGRAPDDRFSFQQHSTPRSLLQKHVASSDINTILKSLASEDDKDIVV